MLLRFERPSSVTCVDPMGSAMIGVCMGNRPPTRNFVFDHVIREIHLACCPSRQQDIRIKDRVNRRLNGPARFWVASSTLA
jgi:hypothetical protein